MVGRQHLIHRRDQNLLHILARNRGERQLAEILAQQRFGNCLPFKRLMQGGNGRERLRPRPVIADSITVAVVTLQSERDVITMVMTLPVAGCAEHQLFHGPRQRPLAIITDHLGCDHIESIKRLSVSESQARTDFQDRISIAHQSG